MISRFRTIEISDPRFEKNNLRYITVKSPHLKARGDISLFIPDRPGSFNDLPILLLLHGVYGSHWAWSMKAGAHTTAQRLINQGKIPPLLIAMPSDGLWGDGSGYIARLSGDYEKWIVEDVVQAIMEVCPQAGINAPLFISGLSMGGYGALRLGAKYAEKFSAISAHSSITQWSEMSLFVEEDTNRLVPPDEEKNAIDLLLKRKDQLPPLRFDCGLEDPLLDGNRLLHQQLEEAGINHQYEEFPGGHEWPYWEKHLEKTLIFCTSGSAA